MFNPSMLNEIATNHESGDDSCEVFLATSRPGPQQPDVSFMIATHNRAAELQKTLQSCAEQVGVAAEVLVVDDASADGTYEMVRQEFPQVNIVRRESNGGSIAARNDILRRAQGRYIIGLDDDSRFIETDACRRVVARMDREADLGIVSFQAIGPEFPERMCPAGRLQGEWHTASFAACGVAIRQAILPRIALFAEYFFHAYEEPDLALRAWDAGYRVLQWNDIVVYHEFSPRNRNEQRTHRRHVRNDLCSIWMRYPWYLVLPATCFRVAGHCRYAARRGWLWREPRAWLEALARLPLALWHRSSVRTSTVKIAVAVNRAKIVSPSLVWKPGQLPWRTLMRSEEFRQTCCFDR
jgi:GT2 family glycosyltransferase